MYRQCDHKSIFMYDCTQSLNFANNWLLTRLKKNEHFQILTTRTSLTVRMDMYKSEKYIMICIRWKYNEDIFYHCLHIKYLYIQYNNIFNYVCTKWNKTKKKPAQINQTKLPKKNLFFALHSSVVIMRSACARL